MHKVITLLSAVALSLGAVAEIVQYPLANGSEKAPYAAKLVGIVVNSSVASGTVSVKDIVSVASSSDSYEVTTNIVQAGADYRVADAYVGQQKVYSATHDGIVWSNSTAEVVIDDVTNIVKVSSLYDGSSLKYGPATNIAASVKYRDVIATAPVTNIVRRNFKVWTHTPYTNTLYTGTLSNGALSADITNKFIIGGSLLVGDGTVYSTSGAKTSAFLILEK